MANHFRSSEGQDGTAAGRVPAPQAPQAQQTAQAAPGATGAQRPNVSPENPAPNPTATPVSAARQQPSQTMPAQRNVTRSQAKKSAQASSAQAQPGSTDGYDPSAAAGFTTAFAPITKEADTKSVNTGVVPVVSFQGVSVVYPAQPNKPALEGVDVDVYAGEFVFLVGHSGSGKSTFLKLITRELKPTHGKIMVAGQDLTAMRNWKVPYLRRQIGCVFQDFKLLPDKTIFDNVAFALECIGKPRSVIKAQVPEVLRLVGLGDKMNVYPDQLSGGEQQRVSVARAMVNRPPLLVCDEPTGNLDPAISLGIMKLLERINRTGTTVLMATHDREMVDSMRKRVIALEAGHVVRDQERGGYGYYGAI